MKLNYDAIVKILDALYREQQMYSTEQSRATEDYFNLLDDISYYEDLRKKVAYV